MIFNRTRNSLRKFDSGLRHLNLVICTIFNMSVAFLFTRNFHLKSIRFSLATHNKNILVSQNNSTWIRQKFISHLKKQIKSIPSSFKAVPWNYQRSILSSCLQLAMGFHPQVHHLSRWWASHQGKWGEDLNHKFSLLGCVLLAIPWKPTQHMPIHTSLEKVWFNKASHHQTESWEIWVQIVVVWAWSIPHRPVCLNIGSSVCGAGLEDWRRLRSQDLAGASDLLGSGPFCLLSAF